MNLPSWVKEIRPLQGSATDQIVDAFNTGSKVVMLDAPTGSGKTLIGDLTAFQIIMSAATAAATAAKG